MKAIGTATFKDFNGLLAWHQALDMEEAEGIYNGLQKVIVKTPSYKSKTEDECILLKCAEDMLKVICWASYPPERTKEAQWPNLKKEFAARLRQFLTFHEEMEQPINVGCWEDAFAFIFFGNPNRGIVVPDPDKYLAFTPAPDFSDMAPAQVRAMLGAPSRDVQGNNLIPANQEHSLTGRQLSSEMEQLQSKMASLSQEMDDTKNARTGELAQLQEKIEALKTEMEQKKEALMAELQRKEAELKEKKEQLEAQIYLLDSQIYAIRCYAGEVVKFAKIRSGKNAPASEPIIVHQKLRFLDEDLGRLASLYEIQWEEIELFEQFLRHSPIALDTFAPNDRCVMLVRLSRTAKQQGRDNDLPYLNVMRNYDYYHGRTVGIIIRNGENVYLGWTDETRVHIDDDLIISQVVTDIAPEEPPKFTFKSDEERWIQKQKDERKRLLDGLISRSFIYNILQGIVDNSSILPLPSGVKLNRQSEYVIYSVADKWLTDNRFGGFTEIIERCNATVQKGDMLLTVQHLVPEHYNRNGHRTYDGGGAWENVRGRGDRNRTHDCSVDDCTLYPANLVEYDPPVPMAKIKYKSNLSSSGWVEATDRLHNAEINVKNRPGDYIILSTYETEPERHVSVSVKKSDAVWGRYTGEDPRANFELYDGEYINLTYMNSVWLEWVITNKTLGGWRVAGTAVEYAYAIRYLKTAMEFIRKREEGEKALLDAIDPNICKDPDWPLKLSEWKLNKKVRAITEHQAKRFAKYIQEE